MVSCLFTFSCLFTLLMYLQIRGRHGRGAAPPARIEEAQLHAVLLARCPGTCQVYKADAVGMGMTNMGRY